LGRAARTRPVVRRRLALELYRRHPKVPKTLVLAYAGWDGSLRTEVVEQRLQEALREADLPPEEWLPGYMPGMFSESAPQELIDEALSIMADVHLAGMRVGLRGFAEADLRDILPRIEVATLLLYGKLDQRSHCPWPRTSTLKSQGRDSWCCPESVT
jgi:pimeloyl-ACP methyl ester carboxylesterase